jgi:hypothetical protein
MIKDHEPELDLDTYKFRSAVKDVNPRHGF